MWWLNIQAVKILNEINSTIYIILARHEELHEDDVLTSKHVAANHM